MALGTQSTPPRENDESPRSVALRVGRSGGDLGSGARVISSETMEPLRKSPVPVEPERTGLGGEAGLLNVALSRGAAARGRQFEAMYGPAGFMLASDLNPTRQAQQLAQVAGAGTDELQAVLRVGATRQKALSDKEVEMRAAQTAANYPENMQARYNAAPDRPKPDVYRDFVAEVGKWDFAKQRRFSAVPRDGVPPEKWQPPSLSDDEKKSISALNRGYRAIAAELHSRGVEPQVAVKGAETGRSADAGRTLASSSSKGPLVRGGIDMG